MIILVVNAGSSTLKCQLIDMDNEECLMKSNAERIYGPGTFMNVTFLPSKNKEHFEMEGASHADCLAKLLETIFASDECPVNSIDDIAGAGNRIVSGGEYFDRSALVTDDTLEKVKICGELAPLHNPHAAACIEALREVAPNLPQVLVFDTAFHIAGLPEKAYRYALPEKYYTEYKIRRYGAHGTSHKYAAEKAAEVLGKNVEDLNIITCHLGSGGSVSAVEGGRCVDTTMGLTPLEGILMGTRTGSMDPAIVTFIMRRDNCTLDEMDDLMNKKSGLLAISGLSNDMRELEEGAIAGNEKCRLALDMYNRSVQKAIGSFYAIMPRTDAVVVTAGIGENSEFTRREIFEGLEHMGMIVDPEKNKGRGGDRVISADDSPVKVVIISADEEMCIARETMALI